MNRVRKSIANAIAVLLLVSATASLSACWSLVTDVLEYDTYHALQNVPKGANAQPTTKQQAKEAEQLRRQGKCPACNGFGKTPDGRYTCTECGGTGKWEHQEYYIKFLGENAMPRRAKNQRAGQQTDSIPS